MVSIVDKLTLLLENIDKYRNEFLYLFIKPHWPLKITPNHVTYIRVVVGVALFVLLFVFNFENKVLIISLFCMGALTDFIDGPVARGTNRVTEFGAILDSTADRILIIPITIYGLLKFHKWLLFILLAVEVINLLASVYFRSKEIYLESSVFGKAKMVLYSAALIAILLAWPNKMPEFFAYFLWLTIPLSFLSIYSRMLDIKPKK